MYADYTFYKDKYHGILDELEYKGFAEKASAYLDYYTMGNAKYSEDLESLKMACCALADKYKEIEELSSAYKKISSEAVSIGKKSETVGSYSVTYLSAAEFKGELSALKSERAEIAKMYLAGTNLLYRGGCRDVCASYCNRL